MLFEICPLTMRTQCILLVRDTVVILSVRPTPNEGEDYCSVSSTVLVAD